MLNAFRKFDDLIYGKLLPHPNTQDFDGLYRIMNDIETDPQLRFIVNQMDVLDSKTSALLTHISLIVAALTFIYSSNVGGMLFKFIIILELSMYLFLSIFCLRAIRLVTKKYSDTFSLDSVGVEPHAFTEELCKRFEAYNFASNVTILVTSIMILTLLCEGIVGMFW